MAGRGQVHEATETPGAEHAGKRMSSSRDGDLPRAKVPKTTPATSQSTLVVYADAITYEEDEEPETDDEEETEEGD